MKLLLPSARLAFFFAAFASISAAAELSGQIVITKSLAKKQVTLPAYQLRGASLAAAPAEPRSINEYGDMVVFLEGELPETEKPVRAELIQRNQHFEPPLLIVPAGSTVSFPNADPIFHNVFSLSSTRKFDLGYYPQGHTRSLTFNEPGVVQVYCHLHPNMYAAIVVTPNQWYTTPAHDGSFALAGIPPGTYQLVAWHTRAGFFRRTIRVETDNPPKLVLKIPERALERP
ncbi:MAG TPA: carboxypeptidase regulatory-like domain-containing protein [Bryobacteraceae bacterium]|jgi:plastocyanin|nr:carboxypeptidase regulatory-like domain-containing protein [Bryobacteraceae bacterium]